MGWGLGDHLSGRSPAGDCAGGQRASPLLPVQCVVLREPEFRLEKTSPNSLWVPPSQFMPHSLIPYAIISLNSSLNIFTFI